MMRLLIPMALSIAPVATGDAPDIVHVKWTFTMNGTCEKLVLPGGGDKTRQCGRTIVNTLYQDGRSSFRIALGDSVVIAFYGRDHVVPGNAASLAVDKMLITRPDGKTDAVDAVGACVYSNPYVAPSRIECRATRPGEIYELTFTSDGKEPAFKDYRRAP